MADDTWRCILPDQIGYGITDGGQVILQLHYPEVPQTGSFELGLALSPDAAREMAQMLLKKADQAEAAAPRH